MSDKPDERERSEGSPLEVNPPMSRRQVLRLAGLGTSALFLPGMLSGCVDDPNPVAREEEGGQGPVVYATAGADPFLAEIRLFSFNFAPKGWALCNGQFLAINQNQALFSLLGTTYGGNGQTTFALPNLQGQVPIHRGNGHTQGERAGSSAVTVNIQQLPAHTHVVTASASNADTPIPTNQVLASANNLYSPSADRLFDPMDDDIPLDAVRVPIATFNPSSGQLTSLHPSTITNVGGSQAHTNMMPYLTLNFCIALQGIFPSRN